MPEGDDVDGTALDLDRVVATVDVPTTVQHREDSERRRREMERLIDELTDTLDAFEAGDFSAWDEVDVAGTVLDADEREMIEQVNDHARMRQALQEQVVEATEAKRDLERQNEKLEQFASMVSHDLRNPINVALGSVDLAREEGDVTHLETARDSLERMEEMVDELLAFARSGGEVTDTESVAIEAVARDAWDNVPTGESTLFVDADDVRIQAHREGLSSVFENLFRNAVEHNDDPVRIRVDAFVDDAGHVTVDVTDDGSGLPAEADTTDLFERGFTTNADGTGFGLSIVTDIVEAHGWDIHAAGSADGGAQFEIHVPD